MENNWHLKSAEETLKLLRAGEAGLSAKEASERLKKYGPNRLLESKADNLAIIFLRQFQSPLIYILIAASLIVFFTGETVDSLIILAVLLFNAAVGTIQEGRAQNTLLSLKKFVETSATVLREGQELIIPDAEIVPGDIIILQEGEKIPADARIILSYSLKIDEAMLTGESEPAHKIAEVLKEENLPMSGRKNLVFKGAYVLSGNGRAVAVATGLKTAIGQIAKEIEAIDTEMPFKANIRYLSRLIIIAVGCVSGLLFLLGIALGNPVSVMFATVVSLAVSIIPEGLPIVITLVLAGGVWRMSRQNVLVKKLQAVEALGQARVIAVDKTGTITKNEMVIQKIYAEEKFFEVEGNGYDYRGAVRLNDQPVNLNNHPELLLVGKIAAFSANARIVFLEETQRWRVAGDPTEAAMQVMAQKFGLEKDRLEKIEPLLIDIPFDYKLKYHATIHRVAGREFLAVAGAPEVILGLCRKIWRNGRSQPLTAEEKKKLELIFLEMSRNGLRVVALAENRQAEKIAKAEDVSDLTFVGFIGMRDSLRPEVAKAIAKIRQANIRVVMITGDHKNTAEAIAEQAGIYSPGDQTLTGPEIDLMSDEMLADKVDWTSVFARVTPEHKLRIIKAYKARGEIVAMTGDGVNDAPSLVAADLGIAMGKIGTEVAKEAADIVLLDDNFGQLPAAVEEGRHIYRTIKRVILYLFSTSVGEALTITGALVIGLPLPILPAQIIWLNFVTDGFLDVALAMEPKEKKLLAGNFEPPKKFVVDKLMGKRMILMALPMAIGTMYLFEKYLGDDINKAWTISLTTLAVFQWLNAWNCRSEKKSLLQMNPFSNKFLVGATFIVIALQFLAVYNPFMQRFLHTVPLNLTDWLVIISVASSIIFVEEIRKFLFRRKLNNK
ncbi:MAG: HAD-IC family P-type ATPase [bacterium]|nr:HAD-IC family P-type ATPase [bacterium]